MEALGDTLDIGKANSVGKLTKLTSRKRWPASRSNQGPSEVLKAEGLTG